MRNRSTTVLALIAVAALLAGVLDYVIVTDEEQIEEVLDDCIRAALANDPEGVRRHVEKDATRGGLLGEGDLYPAVGHWVGRASRWIKDVSLDLQSLEVRGDGAQGTWARGTWHGNASLRRGTSAPFRSFPFEAEVSFVRGPEGWRIRHVAIGRR